MTYPVRTSSCSKPENSASENRCVYFVRSSIGLDESSMLSFQR